MMHWIALKSSDIPNTLSDPREPPRANIFFLRKFLPLPSSPLKPAYLLSTSKMQSKTFVTFIAITLTVSALAVRATPPDHDLEVHQFKVVRWDATQADGEPCQTDWGDVCSEHCVSQGTEKGCRRDTVTSVITAEDCDWWFDRRCRCICVIP